MFYISHSTFEDFIQDVRQHSNVGNTLEVRLNITHHSRPMGNDIRHVLIGALAQFTYNNHVVSFFAATGSYQTVNGQPFGDVPDTEEAEVQKRLIQRELELEWVKVLPGLIDIGQHQPQSGQPLEPEGSDHG